MSSELIFWTQIGTLCGYIGSVFVLYRLMVKQKEATIETLQKQCDFLNTKLSEAEKKDPDRLLEQLNRRKTILEDELQSLGEESTKKKQELESQIEELRSKAEDLESEVKFVNEVLEKYSCPHCNSPLSEKGYGAEAVEHNGREYEVEHEWASFECGYKETDGREIQSCRKS